MAGVKKGPVATVVSEGPPASLADIVAKVTNAPPPDTYRMVDFVKAVAMRDDRGQEVRVNRIRLGAPVDRESPMKVESIVLNGTWFDILTVLPQPDGKDNVVRNYRVHVTNVVSAER